MARSRAQGQLAVVATEAVELGLHLLAREAGLVLITPIFSRESQRFLNADIRSHGHYFRVARDSGVIL